MRKRSLGAAYLQMWGKTDDHRRRDRSDVVEERRWHPACCHMLDVAACAERLFAVRPIPTRRMAEAVGVDVADMRAWLVAAVALHDVGKLTRAFQAKVPELWRADLIGSLDDRPPTGLRHDRLLSGWVAARREDPLPAFDPMAWPLFAGLSGRRARTATVPLVNALAGHHGQPVDGDPLDILSLAQDVGPACEALAGAFVADWFGVVDVPVIAFTGETARRTSWLLNGLTTLADWLGSGDDADAFRPRTPFGSSSEVVDLATYWREEARPRAAHVVRRAGLEPAAPSIISTAKALFGIDDLRPMQAAAESVDLPEGPVVVVVEDLTGSGKTEAAAILAHRLMARGDAGGLYMALPTTATAGAMFDRLSPSMVTMFDGVRRPSLSLAHGKAHLDPRFATISTDASAGGDDDVGAWCSEWIKDDRRRSFLSDVGVGTVDQALPACCPPSSPACGRRGCPTRCSSSTRRTPTTPTRARCCVSWSAFNGRWEDRRSSCRRRCRRASAVSSRAPPARWRRVLRRQAVRPTRRHRIPWSGRPR